MIDGHRVSAILTCAGRSVRFGRNKLLVELNGVTVLETTVRKFVHPMVDQIVVTVSPDHEDEYGAILERAGLSVILVRGAEERFLSAQQGLEATDGSLVMVHDGVRPFVTAEMIERVLRAAAEHGAAMLGMPSVVQLKLVDQSEFVTSSLDRSQSWLGQTPQVFRRDLLERAYAAAIADEYERTSDDADLVAEYTGHSVKIIKGADNNIKLTTPMDLFVAQHIASEFGVSDGNSEHP